MEAGGTFAAATQQIDNLARPEENAASVKRIAKIHYPRNGGTS